MKVRLFLALFPLLIVGCNYPLQGTLDVSSPMTFKDRGNHIFELVPGNHIMEVRMEDYLAGRRFKIKLHDDAGKQRRINVKIPMDVLIPTHNGSFRLSATQSSQPFDTIGTLGTVVTNSPVVSRTEYCEDNLGPQLSAFERHEGTREITYHEQYKDSQISVTFKRAGTEDLLGKYVGHNRTRQTVIDTVGPCIFE